MAATLKSQYGPEIPARIADMIARVHAAFPKRAFLRDALEGYEALELMPRGRHIARALRAHLPQEVPAALDILLASLDVPRQKTEGSGLAPFLYLPHTVYVAEYALEHFDAAMRAQHALTQRFTAEFSIRPFIEKYPERTLAQLRVWTHDPSPHVRRLVSEGTRPRLPWASRLRALQRNPQPALELLELLKDDPSLYVRRSVANHLNDIGKDHPGLLTSTARRWLKDAGPERAWIVRHALRSAIKRGDTGALAVSGFGAKAEVAVRGKSVTPQRALIGGAVSLALDQSPQRECLWLVWNQPDLEALCRCQWFRTQPTRQALHVGFVCCGRRGRRFGHGRHGRNGRRGILAHRSRPACDGL